MIGTKEIKIPSPSGRGQGEGLNLEAFPRSLRVSAVTMGIITGILAVAAGALFEVRPPAAYGVCMACHARDVGYWLLNLIAGTLLEVAPALPFFPVLPSLRLLIAGFCS